MSIELTISIVAFTVFVLFPLSLSIGKRIEPDYPSKDVIKLASEIITKERKIRLEKNMQDSSFEDMSGGI